MQVIDILGPAYTLGDGAKSLLQELIGELAASSDGSPSINDVLAAIKEQDCTGRAAGWKASALRALQSLNSTLRSQAPKLDDAELVNRLLNENTILELDALDENAKAFVIRGYTDAATE